MNAAQEYIKSFLAHKRRPAAQADSILIDTFGDSPDLSDQLLQLILAGTKTATCLSLFEWEHENTGPLAAGTLSVILNGAGDPKCVIETTQVTPMAYQDVTAEFARCEGEHHPLDLPDEQVLEHWRKVHWSYFMRKLPPLGFTPHLSMPVLCERFKVIYTGSEIY